MKAKDWLRVLSEKFWGQIFARDISEIGNMNSILEDMRNTEFNRIAYNTESNNYFEIIEGTIPVLLSAPHGAKHLRKGNWKGEDEYTASLAIKLGELTGAYVIFVKNKTNEDSNYLLQSRYKDALQTLVREKRIAFLADIHGADITRVFKISVGIIDEDNIKACSCPRLKSIIEDELRSFQYPLFNLDGFTAGSPGTVTSFAKYKCGIEAAQFEINAKYRIIERKPDSSKAMKGVEAHFKAHEDDVLKLINYMKEMIFRINKRLN